MNLQYSILKPDLVADIARAAHRIHPVFLNSRQFISEELSDLCGCQVTLKLETENPIRSFKGRGTYYLTSTIGVGDLQLICASAGNFGLGLAYASCCFDYKPVHVFAPTNANQKKIEMLERYRALVELVGSDFDEAKAAAKEFAVQNRRGCCFIEDGSDPAIAAGAGTIALELLKWRNDFDAVLVPVGNGSLINGMGTWIKEYSTNTKVVGVCAAGAPAMAHAWRTGNAEAMGSVNTIADGIAVRVPIPDAVALMRKVVDQVVLVNDQDLVLAMQLLYQFHNVVAEPAGVAGLAAIIKYRDRFRDSKVATVIGGGNVNEYHRGTIS